MREFFTRFTSFLAVAEFFLAKLTPKGSFSFHSAVFAGAPTVEPRSAAYTMLVVSG